jgi:hypothetical protein
LDALKEFPATDVALYTEKGKAIFQKMDIFKGLIWYSYLNEPMNWQPIPVESVNEIILQNKANQKPECLEDYAVDNTKDVKSVEFHKVVGQDELNRFDAKKERKGRNSKNRKRKPSNQNTKNQGNKRNDSRKPGQKNQEARGQDNRRPNPNRNANNSSAENGDQKSENKAKRYIKKGRRFKGRKPGDNSNSNDDKK